MLWIISQCTLHYKFTMHRTTFSVLRVVHWIWRFNAAQTVRFVLSRFKNWKVEPLRRTTGGLRRGVSPQKNRPSHPITLNPPPPPPKYKSSRKPWTKLLFISLQRHLYTGHQPVSCVSRAYITYAVIICCEFKNLPVYLPVYTWYMMYTIHHGTQGKHGIFVAII